MWAVVCVGVCECERGRDTAGREREREKERESEKERERERERESFFVQHYPNSWLATITHVMYGRKYYEDTSMLLRKFLLRNLAPHRLQPSPAITSRFGRCRNAWQLLCAVCVGVGVGILPSG